MFGKGLITGLGVTLKHFFGKKSTFCYPEEKLPMTEHFRGGHLVLEYKKCIGCTLCAQACPNQALKLKAVADANKKRHLSEYVYLMGRCLYCDLCVESCPTKALSWDKEYAISTWHKADMTHDVMTDEDRAYLAHIMAEAAANPKPATPPAKPPATAPAPQAAGQASGADRVAEAQKRAAPASDNGGSSTPLNADPTVSISSKEAAEGSVKEATSHE